MSIPYPALKGGGLHDLKRRHDHDPTSLHDSASFVGASLTKTVSTGHRRFFRLEYWTSRRGFRTVLPAGIAP
jgi:hypothetical protein